MQAYIESLVNEALNEYVEEFTDCGIKVGLWEGDVKLLNMVGHSSSLYDMCGYVLCVIYVCV